MEGFAYDPAGMTALVLDASAFARHISMGQLRVVGFRRAVGAARTSEAWEMLEEGVPDILFIDWLDHEDTLAFVRRVRQSADLPKRNLPIFMLTARSVEAEVLTARQAGVDGYLRKPISGDAMQARVRTVVSKPQPFVVTATYVGPDRRRRNNPDFAGPWRRLDDAAPAPTPAGEDAVVDVKLELARARVSLLEKAARALVAGDVQRTQQVFTTASQLLAVAEDIGDPNLTLGTRQFVRYLQALGATEMLNADVVRTHVAALVQLAHLPRTSVDERARVAQSLKRMVDKKLASGAA